MVLFADRQSFISRPHFIFQRMAASISAFLHYESDIPSRLEEGTVSGTVMYTTFELDGQEFMALNGGAQFTFTPAISFFVNCETQQEVDELWEKLSEGGEIQQYGWLKDKYGVSWQIIPTVLGEMLNDSDSAKSQRVMKAML